MTAATTWRGRRGAVILGPTEHRVAVYLADLTRHGRVMVRTVDLADRLGLGRSEAYRVTARLRVLGLFGIANDRSGARGGRYWWRTATTHDGPGLDPVRHRVAWGRVAAWLAARRARLLASARSHTPSRVHGRPESARPASDPPRSPAASFADLVAPGLGDWFHAGRRRVTP